MGRTTSTEYETREETAAATYEHGWKLSQHDCKIAGTPFCEIEQLGMVLSGRAMAAMRAGNNVMRAAGSLFYLFGRSAKKDVFPCISSARTSLRYNWQRAGKLFSLR